jgi:hypothetical protein
MVELDKWSSRRNDGVGEMVDILATLESEKWWSRRNGGVGEMVEHSDVGVGETLESEKWWSRRNGGHLVTLESEKWWNIIMTVVAVKLVNNRIVIY